MELNELERASEDIGKKKLLFDSPRLAVTLQRLCAELIERHHMAAGATQALKSVLIGMQPRGVVLAQRLNACLVQQLSKQTGRSCVPLPCGTLDTTFHRDDYTTKKPLSYQSYSTDIPFSLEDTRVILVDDVLYTGRATRAALDALLSYGRPAQIELLVLVDRAHSRDFPIEASYVGHKVHTLPNQFVALDFHTDADSIWLVDRGT